MHAWIKNSSMRGKPLPKKFKARSSMRFSLPIIDQQVTEHSQKSRDHKRSSSDLLSETSGIESIYNPEKQQNLEMQEYPQQQQFESDQQFAIPTNKTSSNQKCKLIDLSDQKQVANSKDKPNRTLDSQDLKNAKHPTVINPNNSGRKNQTNLTYFLPFTQQDRGFQIPVSSLKSSDRSIESSYKRQKGINKYLFSTKKSQQQKTFINQNYRPFKWKQSQGLLYGQKKQIKACQKIKLSKNYHQIFKKKGIQSEDQYIETESDEKHLQQPKKVIKQHLMTNNRDVRKIYEPPRVLTTGSLIRQTARNSRNPRTLQDSMRNSNNSRVYNHSRQHIVSIVQYCSQEVGIACYNLSNGQVILCQMIQRMIYTKVLSTLQSYYPLEIVYSDTQANTLLLKELHHKFPRTTFRAVKRNLYNEDKGFKIYEQRGNKEETNPNNHFLAFSALSALFSHLETSMNTKFSLSSMKIRWHIIEDVMIIDRQTILNLEIFVNRVHKNNEGSFFLNFNCFTIGGTRMLRSNILQPFRGIQRILRRQKLLQSLLDDPNLFRVLEAQFPKYRHYESITSKFVQIPPFNNIKILKTYLRQILHVSQFCFQMKVLKQKISNWKQVILIKNLQQLLGSEKLKQLRKITQEYFDHQILKGYQTQFHRSNKKDHFIFLFKIHKFQDQFVELYRVIYTQSLENIRTLYHQLQSKCDIQLKLLQNPARGYYLSARRDINLKDFSKKVQDQVIHITERNNSVTFSTGKMHSLNNRIRQNQEKLIIKSQGLLQIVIKQIQKNLGILFDVNYYISTIDVVLSFYKLVKANPSFTFTKPIFTEISCFRTRNMKVAWKRQRFLRSPQELNLNITQEQPVLLFQAKLNSLNHLDFLYSIGYTAILSQIGCFVPADSVQLSVFDLLVSKSATSLQSVQYKLSHFQSEMVNLNNIMQNIQHSKRSLFLAEEIVKGTQYQDQCAISAALIDQLSQSNVIAVCCVNDRYMIQLFQKAPFVKIVESKTQQRNQQQIVQLMKKINLPTRFIQDYNNLEISDNSFVPNIFQDYICYRATSKLEITQQQIETSVISEKVVQNGVVNNENEQKYQSEQRIDEDRQQIRVENYQIDFESSEQSQQIGNKPVSNGNISSQQSN